MTQGDETEQSGALGEPVELDGVTPTVGGKRGRAVLWCALVSIIVAAVAVVVLRDPPRTPDQDLARVRDFVASAATGRFEGTNRSEYGADPDEPGSRSIDVTHTEGSFAVPDRVHAIDDSGDYAFEVLQFTSGAYFRSAERRSELKDEPWVYSEESAGGEAGVAGETAAYLALEGFDQASLSSASGVLGAFGEPFDLVELLSRLDDVRRVSPGVLEATTTVRELLPADMVKSIEDSTAKLEAKLAAEGEDEDEEFDVSDLDFLDDAVTIRLTHAGDGRLDELVISTESGEGEDRSLDSSSLKFSAWGEPVTIEAPVAADVDLTPGIDEEDLAAFKIFPVNAPASPPAGMVLHGASVTNAEADPEYEECNSVDLSYGPPLPEEVEESPSFDGRPPFLEVTSTEASCKSISSQFGFYGDEGEPQAQRVGPFAAEASTSQERDFGEGPGQSIVHLRFTTGGAVVDTYSNLPQDQVVAAMASFGPLDLASQPIHPSEPPPGG